MPLLHAPMLFLGIPDAAVAAVPVAAVICLMLVGRSAAQAGAIGLALAVLIAWTPLFGGTLAGDNGRANATLAALLEAGFTALTILWIVFAALCVYQLQDLSGAIVTIRDRLASFSSDPRMIAILVAWFFALFMEGAAGFGTPVALAAPLLVGLGFRPVEAVSIALLGHAIGVSFGAVGTPVIPQAAATDLTLVSIARATAILHTLLGSFMVFVVVYLASRVATERGAANIWWWAALAAIAFIVPYWAIAWFVGPELPTLLGALIGGAMLIVVLSRSNARQDIAKPPPQSARAASQEPHLDGPSAPGMLRSASPYLVLIVLVLFTRLVAPIEEASRAVALEWTIGERFGGQFEPLYHPGTLLLLSFMVAGPLQRQPPRVFRQAVRTAALRLAPVSIALFATLGVARLMVHSGMIEELAIAAAANLGTMWPIAAPFVGILGTFATGSATSSNVLFTELQASTAIQLELPLDSMVGAQGFGAATGNVIAPHNIVAGGATVGLKGQEGAVLRRTAIPCLVYGLMGGLLTFAITRWM
ncbi:MAG: L-lactate permease [Dehalococcoidia bacterium]|nr:L-lactate permease [Dehalococcoidia bacterium]